MSLTNSWIFYRTRNNDSKESLSLWVGVVQRAVVISWLSCLRGFHLLSPEAWHIHQATNSLMVYFCYVREKFQANIKSIVLSMVYTQSSKYREEVSWSSGNRVEVKDRGIPLVLSLRLCYCSPEWTDMVPYTASLADGALGGSYLLPISAQTCTQEITTTLPSFCTHQLLFNLIQYLF